MSTNFSLFVNVLGQYWRDNVSDCDTSSAFATMESPIRYNVQRKKIEEIQLDAGGTYTLTEASLATSDWHVYLVTCRATLGAAGFVSIPQAAQGYIATTGLANDGVTAITGKIPLYGVTMPAGIIVPGIAILSTFNLTAQPVIHSQLDGSIFTIYDAFCVEDGA